MILGSWYPCCCKGAPSMTASPLPVLAYRAQTLLSSSMMLVPPPAQSLLTWWMEYLWVLLGNVVGRCFVSSLMRYIHIACPLIWDLISSSTICYSSYDIYVSISVGPHFSQTSKNLPRCKFPLPPSVLNPISWESVSVLINPPLTHVIFCPLIQYILMAHLGNIEQLLQGTISFFPGQAQLFHGWVKSWFEPSCQPDSQKGKWEL